MVTPELCPLVIDTEHPRAEEVMAFCQPLGFSATDTHGHDMFLTLEDNKLSLRALSEPKLLGVNVDFLSAQSLYRKQHGGGKKEPIAKAIGLKGNKYLKVVDATPGLGRDAFVLAALGCHVTMIERSAVVYALLLDGLTRLRQGAPELAENFTLIHGNSADVMSGGQLQDVNCVYLDPMFPHRKKSALVKKEMRLFQQLLGADVDADALLPAALSLAPERVVVKRPNDAPFLANTQSTMSIRSKKHRFDVYIQPVSG
jgi:16S rRNA (guanine1516-N2)-methyltransferase